MGSRSSSNVSQASFQHPKSQKNDTFTELSRQEDLTKIFNSALLLSQSEHDRDFASEVHELTQSASFKAILNAVRQLSRVQGVKEREAAEEIIQTFRKIDEIWTRYVFCEGLDQLRGKNIKF